MRAHCFTIPYVATYLISIVGFSHTYIRTVDKEFNDTFVALRGFKGNSVPYVLLHRSLCKTVVSHM